MGRPVRKTLSAVGATTPTPLDIHLASFVVTLVVNLSAGASLTYTVEYTVDDVFDNAFNPATAVWIPVTGLDAQTTGKQSNLMTAVTAVRMRVTAHTAGTATFVSIQSGLAEK